MKTIAIIGGGLTGCLAALEAAERGFRVVLFERENDLLCRASTANEGKIHLGYVYAGDAGFATAARLIEDALQFRPVLQRYLGAAAFDACVSAPFHYVIPPDSRLPPARIEEHFARVDAHLAQRGRDLGLSYLGLGAQEPAGAGTAALNGAVIATPERAVWPAGIARGVAACVRQHPRVQLALSSHVERVAPAQGRWQVLPGGGAAEGPFDIVINAAWAGRRAIDAKSGFASRSAWFTRFKFGVLLGGAAQVFQGRVPVNATATSGAFGDSVYYPQDDSLYCSWYPVGMCHATSADVAEDWRPRPEDPARLIRDTWAGYARIDPAYGRLAEAACLADARLIGDFIIAKGRSDIDDPASRLHERRDHGPRELAPGYWSIETGKYTSAARCARACIDAIACEG